MKRRLHHRINLILLGLIVLVLIGSCMSRIELGPGKPEPSADTGKPPVQTPDGQPGADEPGADPSEPASPGSDDQAPAGDSPSDAGQADGDGNADGQPGGNQPGVNRATISKATPKMKAIRRLRRRTRHRPMRR